MRLRAWMALGLISFACASQKPTVARKRFEMREVGMASFYASSLAGNKTASGETYDPEEATCAHPRLRFGTRVRIKVLKTGKTAECRINDRGPFVKGRIIDLSGSVAEELGIVDSGVARVEVLVLD